MIEYIVGPVLALLLGMKFTDFKSKSQASKIQELEAKLELVESKHSEFANDVSTKVVSQMIPIVNQVKRINDFVGIR